VLLCADVMTTAVVTGANRGIGLELCRHLRARGDEVIGICRRGSPDLEGLGARVVSGVDVADAGAVDELARTIDVKRIDVLVHNAGVLTRETLEDLDLDRIRRQLEVNALAPLHLTAALLPKLERGSKIAMVTSRMGSIADNTSGSRYGYRMSKAALNMAAKSLSVDLRARGIAVTVLHPGFVQTGMTAGQGDTDPRTAAARLLDRIDALTLETSGTFWHANGEVLPW